EFSRQWLETLPSFRPQNSTMGGRRLFKRHESPLLAALSRAARGVPTNGGLAGWRRSADRTRLQSKFPGIREFYREFCYFGAPRPDSVAKKPLSCSDFSGNSLRGLSGKII